jgi:GT2 family glycosyltransferase
MVDVAIAIPSFRRPKSLERLLHAIAVQDAAANITIIVGDNDSDKQEAIATCAQMAAQKYRYPIDAFVVEARGIANVRNALIARVLAKHDCTFVAMLDDDEAPDAGWLTAFLNTQAQTGADALCGKIRRVFEHDPGAWTAYCDGVSDTEHATGVVEDLDGMGNVLLRRAFLEIMPAPWFDQSFALTGGEDKDFYIRAKAHGARFAWANEAVAMDFVPPSRANVKWAMSRAYSVGNSDMRVFLKYRPDFKAKLSEYARIAAALLLNPPLLVILAFNPNRRVQPLRKLYRAFGKLAALGGRYYDEYSVIHGQ